MNIVVAEDEPLALEDVLSMLGPFAIKHRIAGFRSGNEVLAHAQMSAVDLLITDIRMPGMDGLELIRRLREQTGDFATIVLSGHGEFEYAREGIRLGIVDYLLKPVRTEVLCKAVDAALAGLLTARTGREQARDAQLAQMLSGRPVTDGALPLGPWGIIVTVCENWESPGTWQAAGLDHDFHRRALGGNRPESYDIVDLDAHRRVILAPPEEARPAQIRGQALRIHRAGQAAGVLVHTAYDCQAPGKEPADVLRHLLDRLAAEMRLEESTFLAPGQLPAKMGDNLALESRQRLAHALAHGRPAALVEIEAALAGLRASGATQPAIVRALDDLLSMLRDSLDRQAGGDVPGRESIASAVRACRSYRDLGAWVDAVLRPVLERARGSDTPRELVGKLVAMIQASYWEDISLQAFAAEHGVSLAYFSRLFKDETGVTFSEYQTGVRMAKARELLGRPDLRLHQVSTLVGYSDAKYFGQLFRKVVGVSPLEYQRTKQRDGHGKTRG